MYHVLLLIDTELVNVKTNTKLVVNVKAYFDHPLLPVSNVRWPGFPKE